MTLRDKAAQALDMSVNAAAHKHGIHTDKVRDQLAAYLDGVIKLQAADVRRRIRYLEMIAH